MVPVKQNPKLTSHTELAWPGNIQDLYELSREELEPFFRYKGRMINALLDSWQLTQECLDRCSIIDQAPNLVLGQILAVLIQVILIHTFFSTSNDP